MSKRSVGHSDVFVPAAVTLRPLGKAELTWIRRSMADIAPEWAAELQGICADEATLVLVPDGGDDAIGPSFVISRETFGLRVDQVHWDLATEVGTFASLAQVMEVLRLRLAFCTGDSVPASCTVH
jgi:hypothetical protein